MTSEESMLPPTLVGTLEKQNYKSELSRNHLLYVSYDGLLDPLGQSQILPYIFGLSDRGFKFTIISFEKDYRAKEEICELKEKLHTNEISWSPLILPSSGLIKKADNSSISGGGIKRYLKRLLIGAVKIRKICASDRIDAIHLRGFQSALIFKLSFLGKPYIYDYRSFSVDEWVEAGLIRFGSMSHRVFKVVDRMAVKGMSALVTLENSAEEFLRENYIVPDVPACVIRTSTDCRKYSPKVSSSDKASTRFVHLGGALFPYRVDIVLEFVRRYSEDIGNASIHFFNEGQHDQLANAIEESKIDKSIVFVESVKHETVPGRLAEFDAGLIFIEPSPCRRVCSPTKLGEYLAAGLPVLANKGIEVLHEIELKSGCVKTVNVEDGKSAFSKELIAEAHEFIKCDDLPERCQKVALEDFDVNKAVDLYYNLYCKLFYNLRS
jgi:hypothetical protein